MKIPNHFLLILCAIISISFIRTHAQNSWIPTSLTSAGRLASNGQGSLFVHGTLIYRSTDNGVTWTTHGSGLAQESLWKAIAITSNGNIFIGRYPSVWRSQNSGETWQKIDTTMGDVLVLTAGLAGRIYAVTTIRGVYESTNDGNSWHQLTNINANSLVFDGNGKLYAGMNTTVYSSTDNGTTWIQASAVPGVRSLGVNASGHVFAGTSSNGTFRSTDNGAHWVPIHYGSGLQRFDGFVFDSVGSVFAFGSGGVYRSTDNGDSWAPINRGLPGGVSSLLSANSLFASGAGVFRRNEILPPLPFPPSNLSPQDSAVDVPLNTILSWDSSSAVTSYSLQVASNQNFSQLIYTNGNITGNSIQPASLTYRTTYYWRLYGTGPEGTSDWSDTLRFTTVFPLLAPPTLVSPSNAASNVVINPTLVWNRVTSSLAYSVQIASDQGFNTIVYENLNVNDTTVRSTALQYNTQYFWRSRTIRSDSTSTWSLPWHFITASNTPLNHFPLTVGNSWTIFSNNLNGAQSYYLKQIEKDTILTDGRLYAALRNYYRPASVMNWTPGNWQYLRLEGGRVYMFPDSLLVDFDSTVGSCLPGPSPQICITGDNRWEWLGRTSRVLTLSSNLGFDFWSYVDSMGFGSIHETWFHNYFPIYTIGARINGVEYGNVMAVEEQPSGLSPTSFLLSQNYPNPFNPTTKIEFRVASSGFVSLKVFDLLGREVATLVNEEMQPGSYERTFHAEGLASGIYFYHLTAGTFSQTKKLVLLR